MIIERLDARDDAAMRTWHDTYLSSQRHERPHAVPLMLEEVRAKLVAERSAERDLAFTGIVEGAVVTVGWCHLPLLDNRDQAYLDVHTRPDRRRQGHGGVMLAHLEQVARDHRRSVLVAEVPYPFDAPADGHGTPHADFARSHGYRFSLVEVQRVLELPVADERLAALVARAEPHHRDYTFRQFEGPVPEDLVESFAHIIGTLGVEAPSGEVTREAEAFDVARIRADEKVFAESGRTKFTTVAVDGTGEVAAYSELVLPLNDPGHVYQWGTLARPRDRGHRLGLATKARNLLWAQPRLGRAILVTYNAEVNRHMIAVNEAMGFRPVERLGEFHKRL